MSQNIEVVGVDNLNDYYSPQLKFDRLKEQGIDPAKIKEGELVKGSRNLSFIKADLQDAVIKELFQKHKFENVIHLAAQAGVRYSISNPQAYSFSNIVGTINLLEACKDHALQNIIVASSSSVYGLETKVPFHEDLATSQPISVYAASKKSMEVYCHSYAHLYNIPTFVLRFFTVYGPWARPDMALHGFTDKIIHDKPIDVYGNGLMSRDFTYVEDITESIYRLLSKKPVKEVSPNGVRSSKDAPFRIFNIGNGKPTKLMDFISMIETQVGKKAWLNYKEMQPGDVVATYADCSALFDYIGFKPETVILDGIKKYVEWHKAYYA
jgi:UDP-glucuronate 4-epimerase